MPTSRRPAASAGSSPRPSTQSPKLSGAVERAQRTHTEELYEITKCAWAVQALNRDLQQWERTYNTACGQ